MQTLKKTKKIMKNNVSVHYEKFYTDDVGKHMGNIFGDSKINVKNMWLNAIDAFYQYDFINNFTCLKGDIRIVIANDEGNNNYKFNQYFLSGLDGKFITIQPNTWFGIHNLGNCEAVIINSNTAHVNSDERRLSNRIFNWHSKR